MGMSEQDEQVEPTEEPTPQEEPEPDETPEEGDIPLEEPEPEPGPPEPVDEERQQAFGKIDRGFATYKANVERNLGDDLPDWLFCPLCAAGAVPGFVNRHDLGRVPEDVQANVTMFLGFAREAEYEHSRQHGTCDNCGGRGKVSTGSLVAEHMTITCPTCKGYGYTPPPGTAPAPNGSEPDHAAQVRENLAELETPDRDNWGEPRVLPDGTLNDNYGKMPQFKTVHPVYGVTANLTPEELVAG